MGRRKQVRPHRSVGILGSHENAESELNEENALENAERDESVNADKPFFVDVDRINEFVGQVRLRRWPVIPASDIFLEFTEKCTRGDAVVDAVIMSGGFDGPDKGISSLVHLVRLTFLTLREVLGFTFSEEISSPKEARYGHSEPTEQEIDSRMEMDNDSLVRRKRAKFDAGGFYEAINPSKEDPMLEDDIPDLLPELRPYQRRAAYWMVQREKGSSECSNESEKSPFLSPLLEMLHCIWKALCPMSLVVFLLMRWGWEKQLRCLLESLLIGSQQLKVAIMLKRTRRKNDAKIFVMDGDHICQLCSELIRATDAAVATGATLIPPLSLNLTHDVIHPHTTHCTKPPNPNSDVHLRLEALVTDPWIRPIHYLTRVSPGATWHNGRAIQWRPIAITKPNQTSSVLLPSPSPNPNPNTLQFHYNQSTPNAYVFHCPICGGRTGSRSLSWGCGKGRGGPVVELESELEEMRVSGERVIWDWGKVKREGGGGIVELLE
ncbi:RING-finger, DEAD-like helicase, PHD and SNF2 domain-containing protein [Actinidia rufa]|uniref:RING-finger, DEAD-like helicase, PHD and SNF2 domain-containing protein n=1 Tax=Actinidia rufa TaxID=165716 RepID=A0A7J0GX44_9ERIC|nr:RING-finger, DEAD-like helicase, PHD and SNF2 domain-containing protein [Actinidia rufa]